MLITQLEVRMLITQLEMSPTQNIRIESWPRIALHSAFACCLSSYVEYVACFAPVDCRLMRTLCISACCEDIGLLLHFYLVTDTVRGCRHAVTV